MTRSLIQPGALVVGALFLFGCSGTDSRSGIEEPLLVHGAQFVEGALPGIPVDSSHEAEGLPTVSSATSEVAALRERLAGVSFFGQASKDATSIGVRFENSGTGFFVLPTGAVDAQDRDVLTWSFLADFQQSLAPGRHNLLTVAFNQEGHAGRQASTSLCVRSLRPDNGNACFPSIAPPALVLSLEWDTPVDLDLIVVAPSGAVLSAKSPTTAVPDDSGQIDPSSSGSGYLVYDGNVDCRIDGRQREDVVFEERPESGAYLVYVNLSRHCSQGDVTYLVSRHAMVTVDDDTFSVDSRDLGAGALSAEQANGGASLGTFVAQFNVD